MKNYLPSFLLLMLFMSFFVGSQYCLAQEKGFFWKQAAQPITPGSDKTDKQQLVLNEPNPALLHLSRSGKGGSVTHVYPQPYLNTVTQVNNSQAPYNTKRVALPAAAKERATTLGEAIGTERQELTARPVLFSSKTVIGFTMKEAGRYRLEVLDMHGAIIEVLAEGTSESGVEHGFHYRGSKQVTGGYIARLVTEHEVTSVRF